MKRVLIHILFWCAYLALRSFIEYLWIIGTISGFDRAHLMTASAEAAILESLPEVLFSYYFCYRILPRFSRNRLSGFLYIGEALLILLLCIYLVRWIFFYIIAPHVYLGKFPASPVFEFKRFMTILFNFFATTGIMVAIKTVRMQLYLKEREKNLVKEKLETELKLLRNQINPHFLFNTLNNIYALALKRSAITPTAILKLSELLSFMLYRSGESRVSIAEEIKMISDYIELEKLRFDDRLTVNFTTKIDEPLQPIAPLLFLPLVENAFKHGISESRFMAFVNICFEVQAGSLVFKIENSVEPATKKHSDTMLGLRSTKRQLELMYKDYTINISESPDTFNVDVTINLNSYEQASMPDSRG